MPLEVEPKKMPLLNKYTRTQPPQPQTLPSVSRALTLIETLENEEYDLQHQLNQIEEAKSLEHGLRLRLNVVQQSLQAFRALEAAPEFPSPCGVNIVANTIYNATPHQINFCFRPLAG